MKNTLLNILCGVLCAALIISALCIGAVRGWNREREDTLAAFFSGGQLSVYLEERAMDAANLAVVAARHLDSSNEQLSQLKAIRAVLSDQGASAEAIMRADKELTALAGELAQSMPQLDSVRASARDQAYISTLTRALTDSSTIEEDYAALARNFNNRLTNSPTGWIARLFGVTVIHVQ